MNGCVFCISLRRRRRVLLGGPPSDATVDVFPQAAPVTYVERLSSPGNVCVCISTRAKCPVAVIFLQLQCTQCVIIAIREHTQRGYGLL